MINLKQKAKQAAILFIIALMIATFMPPLFLDAISSYAADESSGQITSIEKFSAKLVRGAQKDGSNYLFQPERPDRNQGFVYRVDYAFQGNGKAPAGSIEIKVPKHLIKNRDGKYDDEFDCGIPAEREAEDEDEFAYKSGTGDDKDYYIVYNRIPVSSGESGDIEFAYQTADRTYDYKDGSTTDKFAASISVKSEGNTLNKTAEANGVKFDTSVRMTGVRGPASSQDAWLYKTWQSEWGDKPSDADNYCYLEWRPVTDLKTHSTQPYAFTLSASPSDGSVVKYKINGKWQNSGSEGKAIPDGSSDHDYRNDYVLTRLDKSYVQKTSFSVSLSVNARVTPYDKVDSSSSGRTTLHFSYEKPVFKAPGGYMNYLQYGVDARGYLLDEDSDSERISNYTLPEFKAGEEDSMQGLRFQSNVFGDMYPWTYVSGTGTSDGEGTHNVTFKIQQNQFKLEDSDLNSDDYEISGLKFHLASRKAVLNEDTQEFDTSSNAADNPHPIEIYAKKGSGSYEKAAVYTQKTSSFSDVNSSYVKETSNESEMLTFTSGVTGYYITTSNPYFSSDFYVDPTVTLKRTSHVLNLVNGKKKVALSAVGTGTITGDNLSFSKTRVSKDYITGVVKHGSLKKEIIGTRNNKSKKKYTVTWRVAQSETYENQDGTTEHEQSGGTFYDLLPLGASADASSVTVYSKKYIKSKYSSYAYDDKIPDSGYTVKTIENYNDSGRTMLIVNVKQAGKGYTLEYDTVHLWPDLRDLQFRIYNPVVYETGNSSIADGSTDNGGNGKDSEYLKNLDSSASGKKFLYADDASTANLTTASATGLILKAKDSQDANYSMDPTIYAGDTYDYYVRFANNSSTKSKNVILFDSLENFTTEDGKSSSWHGTLKSINIGSLKAVGIDPVVYISTMDNLNIQAHHNLNEAVNGKPVWVKATKDNMSSAKAVAIDCSKGTDGKPFTLDQGKGLTTHLYMQSPRDLADASTGGISYNNLYASKTTIDETGNTSVDLIHRDYIAAKLRVVGNLYLKKVESADHSKTISGIKFRLHGTSDYGDDIDEEQVSAADGTFSFKRLPMGTYKLQELGGSDDWLVDREEKTVTVDHSGLVTVSGLTAEDGVYLFPDSPRVHNDVKIEKRSETRDPAAQKAIADIKACGVSKTASQIVTIDGYEYWVLSINSDSAVLVPKNGELQVEAGDFLDDFEGNGLDFDDYIFFKGRDGKATIDCAIDELAKRTTLNEIELKLDNLSGYTRNLFESNNPYFSTVKALAQNAGGAYGLNAWMYSPALLYHADGSVVSNANGYDRNSLNGAPIYMHTITVSLNDNPSALIPDTTFHLSGTSDYGTDVSLDETTDGTGHLSFKNIEKGTYTLTETKANPDYILNPAEYKVYIDNNGIVKIEDADQKGEYYVLKNEPRYHDFSIRKVDKENTSEWLSGAEFRLQGVSELGTAVDKTVTTDDTGLAEFLDVEKGKYILTETKAPANHKLDPETYTVSVSKFGDVEISGLSKDDNGHFTFPDERSLDGKITITKKWVDTGKSDSDRPVPKIHLTTKEPFYEKQAYAVYDSKNQSMTFFRDTKGKYTDGQVDGTKTYYTGFEEITGRTRPNWVEYENYELKQKNTIKTVVFKDKIKPKTCYMWFESAKSLTAIKGLEKLDTSNVSDMGCMFDGCSSLTSLDVSSFNTSNVTDMRYMFENCSSLTSLDVSSFDTSKVTNMGSMFSECSSLTSLDVSSFDTSKVTNMGSMFSECSGLTSLDLSSFDTSQVTNMYCMFDACSKLASLDLSGFNTSNVTDMGGMFEDCRSITSLDVSSFDTSQVKDMGCMFHTCSSLTSLDLSSFNTSQVTDMGSMFYGSSSLTTIYASSSFTTNVVTRSDMMFSYCTSLAGGAGTKYRSSHDEASYAHIDGGTSNPGYFTAKAAPAKAAPAAASTASAKASLLSGSLTSANTLLKESETGNLTTKSQEVGSAPAKRSVMRAAANTTLTGQAYAVYDSSDQSFTFFRDTAGKYTDKQTSGTKTYYTGFENITGTTVPSWNSINSKINSKIKTIVFKDKIQPKTCHNWFYNASSLTSITGLNKLDTSNVTDMGAMFMSCCNLTSLDVSNFDTSKVTNMSSMFSACSRLTSLDVSNFNTSNATNMYSMFYDCNSLASLDLSSFNTSKVTNMSYMFHECSKLTNLNVSSFDTSRVKDMEYMFYKCSSLTSLDLSSFNTSNVTRMGSMFSDCSSLTNLNLSSFNTSQVAEMGYMFYKCSSLTSLDLSSFNTSKVTDTDMYFMFSGCSSLTSLDLSSFDTSKVSSIYGMFSSCDNLNTIVLGSGFTKTSSGTGLTGNWNHIATTSGRKVAKTDAVAASTLMSTYDGSTMSGIWQKEGTPESASPIDIYEEYVSDDSKWTKNGDGTWTYTFDVYDDTAKFYAYEEKLAGYTSSNDEDNQLAINDGTVTKSGTITNTESDYGSLKVSKTVTGDNLTASDKSKTFGFTVKLSGSNIYGTQIFGGVVFTDGIAKIALFDGQSKTFTNLPAGTTYTVTEDPTTDYTASVTGGTGTIAASTESDASVVNTKNVDKSKLTDVTITKTLDGNGTNPDDEFTFTVELEGLKPNETYSLGNNESDNAPVTYTADASGHAKVTFTMKGGAKKILKDLPEGAKYRVTESANAYTPSYVISNADANGTIRQDTGSAKKAESLSTAFETVDHSEKSTVAFTNTKNADVSETRDVTINVKALDSSGNKTDTPLPGSWVQITGTSDDGEEIDMKKQADANGSLTFKDLSSGTYTLTQTQAVVGYQKDTTAHTVTIQAGNTDPKKNVFTISGLTQNNDGSWDLYNAPVPTYKVSLNIKDSGTSKPVENAELALYDSDGNRVAKWTAKHTAADDAMYAYDDGTKYEYGHFMNLPEGTYTLKATSVPGSYTKPDNLTFTVGSSGEVTSSAKDAVTERSNIADPTSSTGQATMNFTEVSMYSSSSISGLPLTGGMGTKLLYILGAALIAVGIATYLKKKKGGK